MSDTAHSDGDAGAAAKAVAAKLTIGTAVYPVCSSITTTETRDCDVIDERR